MTIKYVLRDVESGEYFSCTLEKYKDTKDVEYSEWDVYSTSNLQSWDYYETLSDAEYHQKVLLDEFGYETEIVRIGE